MFRLAMDKQNNNFARASRQGLQTSLMGEVSATSASQILESFWNIWSQVTLALAVLHLVVSTRLPFQREVLARIRYNDGNMR